MGIGLLILLLAINLAISIWNAYAAGALWEEAKTTSWWFKLVVICAATMSVAGFFQMNLIVFSGLALATGLVDEKWFAVILKAGYIPLAISVIGTGVIIWLDSIAQAWRNRDLLSTGVAAWNTYAMAHNVVDASSHLPDAFSAVGEAVGDAVSSEDGVKIVPLVVLAAILSVSLVVSIWFTRIFWKKGVRARQRWIQEEMLAVKPA